MEKFRQEHRKVNTLAQEYGFEQEHERHLLADVKIKAEETLKKKAVRLIFELLVAVLFGALTAVIFFQSVTMQESSMEPTLTLGDKYFMNRLSYHLGEPKNGDIIVFKNNGSDEAALHIRRVIGVPGDVVQIVDGRVLINGITMKEKGDFPSISNPGTAASPLALGPDEYFVLGDNRNNSEDSRYGDIGMVKKKYILGKIWFTAAPLERIGFIRNS